MNLEKQRLELARCEMQVIENKHKADKQALKCKHARDQIDSMGKVLPLIAQANLVRMYSLAFAPTKKE